MDGDAQALLARLQEFDIGGADQPAFMRRLMRQEGWDVDRAFRVIDEYKKFLVLKALHDGEVSPSAAIDKVWHLHLLYTHDYWERLCRDTIGRGLHHVTATTTAGDASRRRAATFALYRTDFGLEPPPGIWDSPTPRRPGPLLRALRLIVVTASLFFGSLLVFYACATRIRPADDIRLAAFAGITVVVLVARYVLVSAYIRRHTRPLSDLGDLSVFDLACVLRNRWHATFTTVISLLLHRHARLLYPQSLELTSPVPTGASEWERLATRALAHGPMDVRDIEIVLAPAMLAAEARAVAKGLTAPDAIEARAVRISYPIVAAAPIAIWVAWQSAGAGTVGSLLGPVIVAEALVLMTIGPLESPRIRNLRASLAARFSHLNHGGPDADRSVGDRVIAVALYGGSALKGTALWDGTKEFNRDHKSEEAAGCG